MALWITNTFGITAFALRDVGLRDAEDPEIFEVATAQSVVLMTKDSNFADLLDRLGFPYRFTVGQCSGTRRQALHSRRTLFRSGAIHF
ncbi:DUF5615 family PIN-like protein [Leptolyngbya sp. AS-A5]